MSKNTLPSLRKCPRLCWSQLGKINPKLTRYRHVVSLTHWIKCKWCLQTQPQSLGIFVLHLCFFIPLPTLEKPLQTINLDQPIIWEPNKPKRIKPKESTVKMCAKILRNNFCTTIRKKCCDQPLLKEESNIHMIHGNSNHAYQFRVRPRCPNDGKG